MEPSVELQSFSSKLSQLVLTVFSILGVLIWEGKKMFYQQLFRRIAREGAKLGCMLAMDEESVFHYFMSFE